MATPPSQNATSVSSQQVYQWYILSFSISLWIRRAARYSVQPALDRFTGPFFEAGCVRIYALDLHILLQYSGRTIHFILVYTSIPIQLFSVIDQQATIFLFFVLLFFTTIFGLYSIAACDNRKAKWAKNIEIEQLSQGLNNF